MTREMAAVVLTCGNAENEMHYLLGQPLEIKAIDMTTPAGRIAISEKEARRLMDQAIADGEIFKEKGIERVLALLSVRGSLIKYIEEPTPIMQIYAVNDMPESIYNIENPVKEAFFLYALTQSYSAPQMGYGSMIDERFRMLSEEEIIEVLKINPGAMCAVPTEQITPDLVFEFINAVWEQKKRFLMGAFRNIPDSMKDYMYYVIMVMSHGYNLSLIPKEERELAIKKDKGDEKAKDLLIKSNLRLVVMIAHRYFQPGLQLADLIQEGNVALQKAVEGYDYKKGTKLSTYATLGIRTAIKRFISEQKSNLKIPAYVSERKSKIMSEVMSLQQKLNREPTLEEISKACHMSPSVVNKFLSTTGETAALDAPIDSQDPEENDFYSLVASNDDEDQSLTQEDEKKEVENYLSFLSPREKDVIIKSFGLAGSEAMSLQDISKLYGVSRERIRQIKERALMKMKENAKDDEE